MRVIECEQGSDEWFAARLGIVSASRFKDVMTQPRAKKDQEAGKLSETANSYLCELVAEKLLDQTRQISAKALDWGNEYEPIARADYEFDCEEEINPVGFMLHDNGLVGASPDSLVGPRGGLEIKSPENPAIHTKTVLSGVVPPEHMPQIQGCLWIAKREWWDFLSFRNDMPPNLRSFVVRVLRDEDYIRDLSTRVTAFAERVQESYEKMLAL